LPSRIAIVGATGAVGAELLAVLQQRGFADAELIPLGSARSAGAALEFGGRRVVVGELTEASFDGVDVAFFSAGKDVSRRFAPIAARAGAIVIDNSSALRMEPDVPLVVPEINPDDARAHRGIIANPNCSAIILAVALWPLHRVNPIRRIVVSTYQAASGAGRRAMIELETQARDVLAGRPPQCEALPLPLAFNVFSHDSPIGPDGYNGEETKIAAETRKIFHAPGLAIAATCIRVPVFRAHSESANVTFTEPMSPGRARELLEKAPGVRVVDQWSPQHFPMPIDAAGRDEVLVGRIRTDISQPDGVGLNLFLSGDQLRKGAALNAVQIAECLGAVNAPARV